MAETGDYIEIEFINWKKWQAPASRYEKTHWFRLSNRICDEEIWDVLSNAQLKCFFLFLMKVSQKNHQSGRVQIAFSMLLRHYGCRKSVVVQTCDQLSKMGIVRYQILKAPIHSATTVHSRATIQTDITDRRSYSVVDPLSDKPSASVDQARALPVLNKFLEETLNRVKKKHFESESGGPDV